MKRIILFAVVAAVVCACSQGPKVTLTVENQLAIDRSAELVEISVDKLSAIPLGEGETYVVRSGSKTVPSQVTHDGLLLFRSGLGANEKATFTVKAGAAQEFATKTKGRLAPERFDDFIWENDRVAFRIYGEALIAKDGPSNGIDALYKRSEEMVIDKWYEDYFSEEKLSYHDDHGTGLDDFKVGRSLGAGAAAPWVDGKLVLNTNFVGHELIDNGPLRTTFRLTYPSLEIGGEAATETRTISIDAGSQLTKVVQEWGLSAPIRAAVGLPLRTVDQPFMGSNGVLRTDEPATDKSSGVYLGAVVPGAGETFANSYEVPAGQKGAGVYHHALETVEYTPGVPLTYYTGFGWERHGDWTAEKWAVYLADFAAAKASPFVVDIK